MTTPKPTPALQIIVAIILFTAVAMGCNNNAEEKKEVVADTTATQTVPPPTVDTVKMDTASTRPIKTTN